MKRLLISIQPKWVNKIASGKKTIEVRKTRPKGETPFKCFIYCTKDKNDIFFTEEVFDGEKGKYAVPNVGNGKVIGEFICDKIDEYLCEKYEWDDGDVSLEYRIRTVEGQKTCLEYDEVREYGNEKTLYFWHISDLKIYDKPKELNSFNTVCNKQHCKIFYNRDCDKDNCNFRTLKKPPQSWCYIE